MRGIAREDQHVAGIQIVALSGDDDLDAAFGNGVATGRIGAGTKLRIVDAVLTGAHEPGTSHHALLGACLDATMLCRVDAELAANRYRTHEFGASVLSERGVGSVARAENTCRRIA
jgi:S-adenosylmethionine:tRNA ribosyltransferase-isomerase